MKKSLVVLVGLAWAASGCAATSDSIDSSSSDSQGSDAIVGRPPPIVTNSTWHCKSAMDHQEVTVHIDAPNAHMDAIHLDEGCTGSLIVHVTTNSADGIKVHNGAHDLNVKGDITCTDKFGIVHQDGVQAMGGERVTFGGKKAGAFKVHCPTGNNGGLWVNEGSGENGVPTDIVCDHCDLFEKNAALHVANSIRSGARNSVLHHGTSPSSPADCRRINPVAIDPVDENNVCID
jgi:hypothetical protein